MSKAKIKKGDTVKVIAGDDKGKEGKVLEVAPEAGRILVEGINLVKKAMRQSEDNPQGGIVEKEAPIAISNVKVSA
ncbi:50S ribosomal protein L24 [Pontiella sp.]|uniref:50S ribosomal protein L24 n=1 Tax=Pontiella sp. TaxID=2837462 RepID=UPI0035679A31